MTGNSHRLSRQIALISCSYCYAIRLLTPSTNLRIRCIKRGKYFPLITCCYLFSFLSIAASFCQSLFLSANLCKITITNISPENMFFFLRTVLCSNFYTYFFSFSVFVTNYSNFLGLRKSC